MCTDIYIKEVGPVGCGGLGASKRVSNSIDYLWAMILLYIAHLTIPLIAKELLSTDMRESFSHTHLRQRSFFRMNHAYALLAHISRVWDRLIFFFKVKRFA